MKIKAHSLIWALEKFVGVFHYSNIQSSTCKQDKLRKNKESIVFNETYINGNMLPKYTLYIYIMLCRIMLFICSLVYKKRKSSMPQIVKNVNVNNTNAYGLTKAEQC